MTDPLSRLTEYFRTAVKGALPGVIYAGVYRYSVVSCSFADQTVDALPLNPLLPSLVGVPMCVPGVRLELTPGAQIMIGFAECNPTLPYVACYPQDPAAVLRSDYMGGVTPVALQGMAVEVTIQPSALGTFGAGAVACPAAPTTVSGTITGGSTTMRGTP